MAYNRFARTKNGHHHGAANHNAPTMNELMSGGDSGRGSKYQQPEQGKLSAACRRGKHSNCFMLGCNCKECKHGA